MDRLPADFFKAEHTALSHNLKNIGESIKDLDSVRLVEALEVYIQNPDCTVSSAEQQLLHVAESIEAVNLQRLLPTSARDEFTEQHMFDLDFVKSRLLSVAREQKTKEDILTHLRTIHAELGSIRDEYGNPHSL